MSEESVQKFTCPHCFQKYDVTPETDLNTIRDHLRRHEPSKNATIATVRKYIK